MRLHSCAARLAVLALATAALTGCGDDGSDDTEVGAPVDETTDIDESDDTAPATETDEPSEPEDDDGAVTGTDACSLLDEAFLNDTLEGQTSNFGDPFDFRPPLQSSPGATCSWKDAATSLTMQLTVEPTADSETDDHSGRAYNIDEEPTVEPQDGPGEKAVLLVDTAFGDLGSDGFPYGYFFVEGDDTVFVETVGLDVGAEALRTFADEAHRRLLAG
jgi:hypothetical protein